MREIEKQVEEVEDTGSMESMVDLDNNRTSIQANVATDNSPETDDLDLDDELVILEDYPKVEFLISLRVLEFHMSHLYCSNTRGRKIIFQHQINNLSYSITCAIGN